ncbi:MAG: 4Fe-4S dicluster domain-containing protein [Acidobacteriota bacterium]
MAIGFLSMLALGGFSLASLQEGEYRAAKVAAGLALGIAGLFFIAAFLPDWFQTVILAGTIALAAAIAVWLLLPIGRVKAGPQQPQIRVDERDVMFARARLRPGTPEFSSYYSLHPENRAGDDLTRSKPGLRSPLSQAFDPFLFSAAEASFHLTKALRNAVDGEPAGVKREASPADMTRFLRGLAIYYGALAAGITRLEPYHVYSHIGRGTGTYGDPVRLDHSHAIAFTVEMDFSMIGANPAAPGLMESARQYVEAARIALQLAAAIRELGHSARAHIDGNYRVIAPLVARDAGLGEIGRMGLLMTPCQGPRIRIGVVTTDLELIPDARRPDPAVIDFCRVCRKCAQNCPSRSIPFDDRRELDGALRWRINGDTCFRYWCVIGTDCGICMTVCPYSHPDTAFHRIVREAISRSGAARRAALWMDDLFYGRRPSPKQAPAWTQVGEGRPPISSD